jgi:transposase
LIFLDESGVSTQMTRRYARAPRGVRVHETTPEGNWKILTILGAMSLSGMIATMTIEAATDAEIFLAYLDHVLCPVLRPGNVVVMDNLSSHKVAGVRERIAAVGAELLYLPPYSPDLNPIEKAWAKLKQLLRSAKARTAQALDQAITELLPNIRPQDAKHGSEHLFMLYSKEEYALKARPGRGCRASVCEEVAYAETAWVQNLQRVAAMGMSLRHCGQGFVVGATGPLTLASR